MKATKMHAILPPRADIGMATCSLSLRCLRDHADFMGQTGTIWGSLGVQMELATSSRVTAFILENGVCQKL